MELALVELGDGGELVKNTNDLKVIFGFENIPYLALFGGNVEQSTPTRRDPAAQDFSWWGNNLLMPNDSLIQFNSETERVIKNTPLTSFGRTVIEDAIKTDLQVMSDYVEVTVQTEIVSDDRLEILITLMKPSNLTSTTLVFIWDATMQELSIVPLSVGNPPADDRIFDYTFDDTFA